MGLLRGGSLGGGDDGGGRRGVVIAVTTVRRARGPEAARGEEAAVARHGEDVDVPLGRREVEHFAPASDDCGGEHVGRCGLCERMAGDSGINDSEYLHI